MHDPELGLVAPEPDVSGILAVRRELVLAGEPEEPFVELSRRSDIARVHDWKGSSHATKISNTHRSNGCARTVRNSHHCTTQLAGLRTAKWAALTQKRPAKQGATLGLG